jgi:lipid-A-disaccharide synthase
MLAGVVGALGWAVPAFRKLNILMKRERVDLVILVDSPTFNLPLAWAARRRGIKTFYYIAPQVWAWAEFRVRKIRRRVDRLAVILPFEAEYFKRFGIRADFVGHPFINRIKDAPSNPDLARRLREIPRPRLLLMPGSRRHVVKEVLPAQLRVVRRIAEELGDIAVTVAAWGGVADAIVDIATRNGFQANRADQAAIIPTARAVNVFTRDRRTLIENATLVLAASGTGTLEVAWHARPMIVMYNASKIGYHLVGRWLIRTRYLSLLNILAGKELVPEFMPYIRDEGELLRAALRLLKNRELALRLGWEMQALVQELLRDDPSREAARLAHGLITSGA